MLGVVLGCMVFVIMVTVLSGVFAKKFVSRQKGKTALRYAIKVNMAVMASLVLIATMLIFTGASFAEEDVATDGTGVAVTETAASDGGNGIGLLAAALSTGMATIGAGIAVAVSASAALGAISEDSSILGKTLIFVGLAEGIAIYGLIISIMILNKV
jgi:V/A-type H+-transporting ATPase subunit K